MDRKEARQFNISVEGANCETMYFEHLAKLVNNSGKNTYNLKIKPIKSSPFDYAKRNSYKPVDKNKNKNKIPYIHIQDIENYYDDYQRKKFYSLIDEMRKAEKEFRINYILGYSNYTFELWMLLHIADMTNAVKDRHSYLSAIDKYFHRKYINIDEFKKHNEFQAILDEFVTLDSIKQAIKRAETIVNNNANNTKKFEEYKGVKFYKDNPDISVHNVIKLIFDVCEVK